MILYIVKVTFQRDIKFVSISYLIYMENEVKLTDILKAFVQRFHKYLKWNELKWKWQNNWHNTAKHGNRYTMIFPHLYLD